MGTWGQFDRTIQHADLGAPILTHSTLPITVACCHQLFLSPNCVRVPHTILIWLQAFLNYMNSFLLRVCLLHTNADV